MFMTPCERLKAVELVSLSAVEAVVDDARWYEQLSSIRNVVLLPCWRTAI